MFSGLLFCRASVEIRDLKQKGIKTAASLFGLPVGEEIRDLKQKGIKTYSIGS